MAEFCSRVALVTSASQNSVAGGVVTAEGAGHLQSRGGIGKDEMTFSTVEISKDQSPSWMPHRTVFQTHTINCDPFDPT